MADQVTNTSKGPVGQPLSKDEQIEALRAQIATLNAQLDVAADERNDRARYFASADEETPTGRTIKRKRCKNPAAKTEGEQDWFEEEVPTYWLKIDLPPIGGVQLLVDGESLQHGISYEMTMDRVRMLKDMMFRLRQHEASIKGHDEDTWRPRHSKQVSMKTGVMQPLPANWGQEFVGARR